MKQNHIAKSLLAGTGVSENDAARLTLEAIETLGELATGTSRPELVTLLRRVIQAGVAAVKAAEHTVSLSVAAWASVEARKDLRPTTRRDLRHWVPDVCRHTFATHHAAMFRNLPELQLEMGHRDTSLLRSRYMVPARRKDAASFWQSAGLPRSAKN